MGEHHEVGVSLLEVRVCCLAGVASNMQGEGVCHDDHVQFKVSKSLVVGAGHWRRQEARGTRDIGCTEHR